MSPKPPVRLLLSMSLVCCVVWAAPAAEIWEGLLEGDIIVQESTGPLAESLKQATGSHVTHVGIMRQTGVSQLCR